VKGAGEQLATGEREKGSFGIFLQLTFVRLGNEVLQVKNIDQVHIFYVVAQSAGDVEIPQAPTSATA
jgi:hypothetical protein